MAAAKKDTKDSSAEVKALKAELEKTKKALAEALEQIEKLKNKETGNKDGHEYVDLGLSVKWATCNVGATSPEDYGHYFACGETSPKEEYTEENSLTYGKQINSIIAGDSNYDAARANWGGSWRMPIEQECQELIRECKWEWVTVNGVNGYKVTGPSGASIFLPATGYRDGSSLYYAGSKGYYRGSMLYESNALIADGLTFNSDSRYVSYYYPYFDDRYLGRSVRPVVE